MKLTGIYGGSFNPATFGHLNGADESMTHLNLDEVWMWMSHNIFKDRENYASIEHRRNILQLYTKDRSWMKIQDMEKDFCGSYTADSLALLQAMYPARRFIWIFGDDNFATFHTWNRKPHEPHHKIGGIEVPDWKYIMHNFPVGILNRPPYREEAQTSPAATDFANAFVQNPRDLGLNANGWAFINNVPMEISSSSIRADLMARKHNINGLLPEAERYIYDNKLFNTGSEFNAVAAPPPETLPNSVPLQTFIVLAATANLVKSSMLQATNFSPAEFVAHAAACWEKSNTKGDLGKSSEIPGEVADNLISLYWLAKLQGIRLHAPSPGRETQDSVSQWCDTHYPGEDLKQRAKNCLEELAELCVCEGMEKARMVNLLKLVLEDPDADTFSAACTRTMERLGDYAEILKLDLQVILDEKMKINRARGIQQSIDRNIAKLQSMDGGPT